MSFKIFFRNFGHILSFPFVALSLWINLLKSSQMVKKYDSEYENLLESERYDYVYKLVNKAIFLTNCKINYNGIENIPNTPVMFVCNHKSSIDPLLLIDIFSNNQNLVNSTFVSKIELLNDKKIGNAAKLIDTIFIDRNNIRSAIKCLEKEKETLQKKSVVVFIEGTRVNENSFGEFKSAAIEPAYSTMRPIVPVVIHGTLGVKKGNNLFKYKEINISFLKPIKYKEYFNKSREAVVEQFKKKMILEYERFDQEK